MRLLKLQSYWNLILFAFVFSQLFIGSESGRRGRRKNWKKKKQALKITEFGEESDSGDDFLFPPACPDKGLCFHWQNRCMARNDRIKVYVNRRCPCTCDQNVRFAACCKDLSIDPDCSPMCAYNVTDRTLLSLPNKCVNSEGHIWAYCAAQGVDHRGCCAKNGVPSNLPCFKMCDKGQLPCSCGTNALMLRNCAMQYNRQILECYKLGTPELPHWTGETRIRSLSERCTATKSATECFFKPDLPICRDKKNKGC